MKAFILIVLLVLATHGNAKPTKQDAAAETKSDTNLKAADGENSSAETMQTSNNYGFGYYPRFYTGPYDFGRPEYIPIVPSYGGATQWRYSTHSAYSDYGRYDNYYRRPTYMVWG